jgi:hypothetical protein
MKFYEGDSEKIKSSKSIFGWLTLNLSVSLFSFWVILKKKSTSFLKNLHINEDETNKNLELTPHHFSKEVRSFNFFRLFNTSENADDQFSFFALLTLK